MNKSKIHWGEKLTSRKLWCAVAAAVAILVTAFFRDELTPETVDVIKTGVGVYFRGILRRHRKAARGASDRRQNV